MAFLLKHVVPLKLWVVRIVYIDLDFHMFSFHIRSYSLAPFLTPSLSLISIALAPHLVSCILYCLYPC